MKSTHELLSRLRSLSVKLWVDGDNLRYRAPKGTMTPALSAELQIHKVEILRLLDQSSMPPIQPIPDQEHYELSHAQRRLWVLSQIEEGSSAYNIPLHQLLRGELDRLALEGAVARLVERHESLRTTFITVDGEPRQKVHQEMDVPVRFVDLTNHDQAEEASAQLGRADASRPFDLEKGPLVRAFLIKLDHRLHAFLFTMHHIISDGVSISVLMREFAQVYQSFHLGKPSPLPALRIQYRDYASWQHRLLNDPAIAIHRDYWHEKLAGEIPVLNLPTDFPRPSTQSSRGRELAFSLDATRLNGLLALSRQQTVSLFMILVALVKVLLHRYTGQEDIIVGSPIAGRIDTDLEDQVGFYLNMLPLRDQVKNDSSFDTFLQQVKQTATEAYDHQIYPFDRLVDEANVERDLSRSPLSDVIVILQNQDESGFTFEDLEVRPFFEHPGTSKVDLTFCFKEMQNGLLLAIEYSTDLFQEERIQRIGSHFQQLVDGVLADPGTPLGQLRILADSERKLLREKFNSTTAERSNDQTLVDLFQAQVKKTPDAVAVRFEEQRLTYSELNRQANQLAHYLRSLGVAPEVAVGLYVERSIEMLIGLLGILKAGGFYVPLDPAYPKERLDFMADDSRLKVLVTLEKLIPGVSAPRARVVCLDTCWEVFSRESEEDPCTSITLENLAYVIYTSGSTGRPKGVQISHQSLVNCLYSMCQQPGLTGQDTLLAVTTVSFDIAALELYLPLMVGAQVVLVSRQAASDGLQLLALLNRSGSTVLQATPATWQLLLAAGWEVSPHLKILCGGEALPWSLASHLLRRGAAVWNLYGPTETTIWSAVLRVQERPKTVGDQDAYIVPIGQPIANTEFYILDRSLEPVPIGVPGQMYIGGKGLARGYLNRPDLTADRFAPNPFSREPGGRLYQTGDLVRYQNDGSIEFLGRLDQQVKIRGYRIEPGEIEAVVREHSAVEDAVVIDKGDDASHRQLVAYVVLKKKHFLSLDVLRQFLKEKLPEYMVPSAVVIQNEWPRTPNGKIDRNSLRLSGSATPDGKTSYAAPGNKMEEAMAAVWQKVLNVERVGIHDSFFDLGGNSLKATKAVFMIQRDLGSGLTLADIFRQPTVAGLASMAVSRGKSTYSNIQPLEQKVAEEERTRSQEEVIASATAEELEVLNE